MVIEDFLKNILKNIPLKQSQKQVGVAHVIPYAPLLCIHENNV
jgi:hypothetical protein